MKFSKEILKTTETQFNSLKDRLGENFYASLSASIGDRGELSFLLKWIYFNSPYEDAGLYPFSLYENTAKHALYLLENSPFCKDIDERDFLSYVVHPRVGDEQLSDCREFFHSLLKERVSSLGAEEAAKEVNRFCAENVTYAQSDLRTRSALQTFEAGAGRCGEESVFAVNALRAVGIPARQVYVPRWSHCDDNHAWVEVFIEGSWHYFGACEIEEILDCGWFNRAASRALMAYARRFGAPKGEEVLFWEGPLYYINVLPRYAPCKDFTIYLKDFDGNPSIGARVDLLILNEGKLVPVARLRADMDGKCSLKIGLGSVCIRAVHNGVYSEYLVDTSKEDLVTLAETGRCITGEFTFIAPTGEERSQKYPTPSQKEKARRARARAEKLRLKKPVKDVLQRTKLRKKVLKSFEAALSLKDKQDISQEALWDAYISSYSLQKKYPHHFYEDYLLCPRIENEPLLPYRREILTSFSKKYNLYRAFPFELFRHFSSDSIAPPITRFYGALLPTIWGHFPIDERTRDLFCVEILRAFGLPARLSFFDKRVEYYDAKRWSFVPVGHYPQGELFLSCKTDDKFSISRLDGREIDVGIGRGMWALMPLHAGVYRLIVQHRLPNGNIKAFAKIILVRAGRRKTVHVEDIVKEDDDLLIEIPLKGTFLEGYSGAVALLDKSTEPSEHFLSERDALPNVSLFEVKGGKAHEEGMKVFSAEDGEEVARRLFLEPGVFPLLLVIKDGVCRFAMAGYRVGSAQMLKKAYEMVFERG